MFCGIVGSGFVLLAGIVYACSYQHRDRVYAAGKKIQIAGGQSFRILNPLLQIAVGIVSIGSFLADGASIFLEVHENMVLTYFGIGISACGLWMFVVAKRDLRHAYSPCFDSFVPEAIVCTGIYKYLRHPIYGANILFLGGLFVATGSLWILILIGIWCAYYIPSAFREEVALRHHFPEYDEYMKTTKRFIPFVY